MPQRADFYGIAGAGIAGMTLALALAQRGARVTVLERNPGIQEAGAGLQISPNASRILKALGLGEAIKQIAFAPQGIEIFPFAAKKPLQTLQLGAAATERFGHPYYVMHRADLAQLLFAACKRFANIDIRFDVHDFRPIDTGANIELHFTTPMGPETLRQTAFIGADGVNSATRMTHLGGPAPTPHGAVAWRTLIPFAALEQHLSTGHTSLLWGPGFHAVAYPLAHRHQFNIALFAPAPRTPGQSGPEPSLTARVRRDPRFAAILAASADWTFWPLATVAAQTWHRGHIGLIGDAAHAVLPFQAQGAAMAIEDAMVLAGRLQSKSTPALAFAGYQSARQARLSRVAQISARNADIFHMKAPAAWARDMVVKLRGPRDHFKRLDWLYDYDPE